MVTRKDDVDNLDNISDEQVNFIYDNAKGLMNEIKEGQSLLGTRVTLLLSYLTTILAICIGVVVKTQSFAVVEYICMFIAIGYVALIFYVSCTLLVPEEIFPANTRPAVLRKKSNIVDRQLKELKFAEITSLEKKITENLERQKKRLDCFKKALLLTYILPMTIICLAYLFIYFQSFHVRPFYPKSLYPYPSLLLRVF